MRKIRKVYECYAGDNMFYNMWQFLVNLGTPVICYSIARGERITFSTIYRGVKYNLNLTWHDISNHLYDGDVEWLTKKLGHRLHYDYKYWDIA